MKIYVTKKICYKKKKLTSSKKIQKFKVSYQNNEYYPIKLILDTVIVDMYYYIDCALLKFNIYAFSHFI